MKTLKKILGIILIVVVAWLTIVCLCAIGLTTHGCNAFIIGLQILLLMVVCVVGVIVGLFILAFMICDDPDEPEEDKLETLIEKYKGYEKSFEHDVNMASTYSIGRAEGSLQFCKEVITDLESLKNESEE